MLAATSIMVIVLVPVIIVLIERPAVEAIPMPTGHVSADDHDAHARPSRRALLGTPGFWTMVLPFAIALLAQVGFIVHQVPFLEPLVGRATAGLAVTLMATMSLIGRLTLGLFVDRLDPRLAAAVSMTSQAAALLLLLQASNAPVLLLACAVYGFSVGNMITFPPLIIQREIGRGAFAMAMGLGTSISGIVSAFGPGLVGLVRGLTGDYTAAFALCLVLDLVAAAIVLWRPRASSV
jgi:predicted MFS family arabinose efflux permease